MIIKKGRKITRIIFIFTPYMFSWNLIRIDICYEYSVEWLWFELTIEYENK